MSDMVIGDYTAAATIDGSAHYLLIQPGSSATAYKRINRNVLLGVSGQPADISTAQNVTNKTLDNTNAITLKDTLFTLQDNLDTTKQAAFQLSGITTGTTRTYSLPNANSTLVDTATAQILTNKTLTSPSISGGIIDNTTITVDSIAGHTSATVVTVGGVQMNNGTIGTSNAIVTASIADSAVTPAKLLAGNGSGWSYQSWTPTWTNLAVGSSTVTAKYIQTGKTVNYRITVVLGGGNAPSGGVTFTLPVTSITYPGTGTVPPIGLVAFNDSSTTVYQGVVGWATTTTGVVLVLGTAGTYATQAAISAAIPFAFGNGDEIIITGSYEAA